MMSEFAGLTVTEQRIVKEFLDGHEPKEISQKLGVSIRTVYKALYKYRKNLREMGLEKEAEMLKVRKRRSRGNNTLVSSRERLSPETISKSIESAVAKALANIVYERLFSVSSPQVDSSVKATIGELCSLLRDFNKNISELKVVLNKLSEEIALLRERLSEVGEVGFRRSISLVERSERSIPSYLLDNPWIEVLRMRGKD